MSSPLFYTERRSSLPETRYHLTSLEFWCRTNLQRTTMYSHRRLSEVQTQGMAYVISDTLKIDKLSGDADVGAAFAQLAQTCKLAALTVDYIIQGKLTDFTGQPVRITEVAKMIKNRSQLYTGANADSVWMLIAPPDSRTGDWTSFVPAEAAVLTSKHALSPMRVFQTAYASDPLSAPGALLRYYAYQALLDAPAQFFRLVSDTELVSTTAAMAERRRGLLRVAAACHALSNLPTLLKLRLLESSFERLSKAIGPIPLTQRYINDMEASMMNIKRVDVFPTRAIADRICAWADDSKDSNLLGMYREAIAPLTNNILTDADFDQYPLKDANGKAVPAPATHDLTDFYSRIVAYTAANFSQLARTVPVGTTSAEFLDVTPLKTDTFKITAAQRFLMTGLPLATLRPRFNVGAVLTLANQYVQCITSTANSLAGHHEAYITQQDATELPKLFSFDAYLQTDPNPWLASVDRQNGPNMSQSAKPAPIYAAANFCDFPMSPALSRDMMELELPLVVDSKSAREAMTKETKPQFLAFWDDELRSKITELIPEAGPTLLPVQCYPSSAGIRMSRLVRIDKTASAPSGAAAEVVESQLGDTVRDFVTRATGLSGKYLAIALSVEGTRRRLATLLSSFCTVYVRKASAGDAGKDKDFDASRYEQVIGEGVPYGLTGDSYTPGSDVDPQAAYEELTKLCSDDYTPIVNQLVYVRVLTKMPEAAPGLTSATKDSDLETAGGTPYYSAALSIGRRYVGVRRTTKNTDPVLYFVEAPALIHMALLPAAKRFGCPPSVVLSRTHAYTLETTAVLAETAPSTSAPLNTSVDRYTTWSGIALDRLALHGETSRVVSGSGDLGAVEMALAEAVKLTAAAEAQVKESLTVAATPADQAAPVEEAVKKTAATQVKSALTDKLPTA